MGVSRSVNTMAEVLKQIIGLIAEAKLMPDADLSFLLNMETQLVQYLRQPIENMAGQMPPSNVPSSNPGNMPGGGGMPSGAPMQSGVPPGGAPGPMMPPSPMAARAGVGAAGPGAAPPNMDELRRMLSGGQ